jgi:hypothetical protein
MIINITPRSELRKPAGVVVVVGVLALGIVGCGGPEPGFDRYVPEPGRAREAVVAVLDAWRDGRPPGEGVGPKRDVHVVDKQRPPGQRLVKYEMLGEVAVDQGRGFAVRLTLENPDERRVVRYLAVGIEPLWVFRQEDFEMVSHWMHPMEQEKAEGKGKREEGIGNTSGQGRSEEPTSR